MNAANELALFASAERDYALVGPIDNRVQEIETRRFPFNTICHLGRDFGFGLRWGCSGTLFAPRRVLTAAHCLYSLKLGRAPNQIAVAPGRSDRDQMPYGRRFALAAYVPLRFIQARSRAERRANDYGLVILHHRFPPLNRFLPLHAADNAELHRLQERKISLTIAGYPADRPVGTLWRHSETLRGFSAKRLFYTVDTCPGDSGSPVWAREGDRWALLAVHTTGILDELGRSHGCARGTVMAPPGSLNSGVRLTPRILANLGQPQSRVNGALAMIRVI